MFKGICDACGRYNPDLISVSGHNIAGLTMCDKLCTKGLDSGWRLYKVSCSEGTNFYAVKGARAMYYDEDLEEWSNSVMNSLEIENLQTLGLATVEMLGVT